jgi:uncharacterized protein (UPF0332 family)
LRAAQLLLEQGLCEDAVSRAYYAVLHAAKAALITVGEQAKSHDGVRMLFGLRLVNTGILDKAFARILTAEQEDREIGDYEIDIEIGEERARRRIEDASRFVERMAVLVRQDGGTVQANDDRAQS